MEVAPHLVMKRGLPPTAAGPPFQRRDVQEWSHVDQVTGALETGRVETGRWAATTSNSSHHFGQVVDLRARNRADGSQEQRRQKKQLEVFQASIPGGSVQVIRSQTTTSSWHGQSTTSSKLDSGMSFGWSHALSNSSQSKSTEKRTSDEVNSQTTRSDEKSTTRRPDMHFDNLQLAIHPLDVSPQKTKASIGRSGSISGRRPPTRPRSIAGTGQGTTTDSKTSTIKEQQQQRWQSSSASSLITKSSTETKSVFSSNDRRENILNPVSLFSITGNRGDVDLFPVRLEDEGNKKKLFRMKSCSSEDLRLSPDQEDTKNNESSEHEWRRDSLERRSLQLPPVQPKSSDKKVTNMMRSRIESQNSSTKHTFTMEVQPKDNGNQTVIDRLKGSGWKSIEDVLKKNFDDHLSNSRNSLDGMVSPSEEGGETKSSVTKKKNTFITVESLNAVRGRLRRTDSFNELLPGVERSNENIAPQEDDGVMTESLQPNTSVSDLEKSDSKSVKSFVYGIETVLQGDRRTGSLETRGTNKMDGNGLTSKTEEWYNRRKSYGFEPVRQQQQQSIANRYSSNLNTKINLAESTDSGICRSSETVANTTPWYTPTNKLVDNNENHRTSHTITIKNSFNYDNLLSDSKSSSRIEQLSKGIGSKGKKTVVTVGNEDEDNWRNSIVKKEEEEIEEDYNKLETKNGNTSLNTLNVNNINLQEPVVLKDEEREIVPRGKVADALRSLREKSSLINSFAAKRLSEPITISIPSPVEDSENAEVNDFLLKQTKDPIEADRYKLKKFLDSETKNVQTSYSKLIFGEGKIKSMSKSYDGQSDNEFNGNHETISNRFNLRPVSKINQPEFKRHSIAVDETKYITNRNKDGYELSSAINDNSNYRLNSSNNSTFVSPYASKLKPSDKGESSGENDSTDKKQKKVEFCKTEVHFAAEPGRFNIVETDGKPPSNMNFRRRRKTISESTPRNNSNLPEIRFGDLQYEKALLTNKNGDDGFSLQKVQKEENSIVSVPKEEVITILPETIHSVSSKIDENVEKSYSGCGLSNLDCDTSYDDNKTLDIDSQMKPRSILKCNMSHPTSNTMNGSQEGQYFVALVNDDKHTSTNGIVRLNASEDSFSKPSSFLDQKSSVKISETQVSRSTSKTTITSDLKSRSDCEEQVETELQKLLKSLRPTPRKSLFSTDDELSDSGSSYPQQSRYRNSLSEHNSSMAADNGLAVHITSKPTWISRSPNPVENIHKIEEFKTKGFSTRVNFGSEETMVVNSESVKKGLPIEQRSSPYSTEAASRILGQSSNSSDNNVGDQPDDKAVSTTTQIRFNAAPDLNHRLTTNKHNEITVTSSPTLVKSSSDNENISSASLVLKMLLNRAAQSKKREIFNQRNNEQGIEAITIKTNVLKSEGKFKRLIEDGDDMKPSTTQFYTAHTTVASYSDLKDNNYYNDKNKSSPSSEQGMMNKMINIQGKELIKDMDKYYLKNGEVGFRNGSNLDADDREERLSRVSNDSILEALENLSKQIENDIIEIPKVKYVKKKGDESKNSVFKVIEDSGDTRMKRFLRRRTDSSLSQSQLSDDTLQADEEVKSYMSAVSDVRKLSDSSDSDETASKSKNCDRLTNLNRRNRRVVKNRTKEPCTSQYAQGIISQPKNKIPDDMPKGQSAAKFFNESTNKEKSIGDKSVETLVSTRSGHPRITSISLRYNDSHETNGNFDTSTANNRYSKSSISSDTLETNGASFDTSTANNRYSKNSICIEPCDTGSSTSDISSSWKWSKGTRQQSVRTSSQNVSLSNIYSNARTIEPVSSREDITSFPEDDTKTAALSYPKTKSSRTDTEHYQRKQVVKSASDQCVLLSTDKPQFGKVTAVVPPTVAYSSSVVLNYQPSPTQINDHVTTQNIVRSHQASSSTSTNFDRKRINGKTEVDKSKVVSDRYRRNVNVSSTSMMSSNVSSRRDSWLNLPKDATTNQVEQTRQSRDVRVDKLKKKSSAVEVRKKKKSTDDNGSIEGCSDDLTTHFRGSQSPITVQSKGRESPIVMHSKSRESPIIVQSKGRESPIHSKGRESPIYANSRVFAKDYTSPSCSDRVETESFILEELTKAADEILRAVNGYTDDDSSFKGSSDDEPGKRYGKDRRFSSKPLGTISETPTKKEVSKSQMVETKMRSSVVKNKLCKTSSNSSVEGGASSADSKPLILEKPSKRRNVRLLQRASSREMLMKSRGAASSSEDVQSGSEQPAPPPRVTRTRTSRHTSHQKSTIASQSRTKERVQKTVSSADNSSVKAQSTVASSASNIARARHDARKRTTTKSKTSTTSSISASTRRLGGRLSPEGAEQQMKKETALSGERLPRGDEPQPPRAAVSRRTASRTVAAAAVIKKKPSNSSNQPEELIKK